jgi:hypothetical protein
LFLRGSFSLSRFTCWRAPEFLLGSQFDEIWHITLGDVPTFASLRGVSRITNSFLGT